MLDIVRGRWEFPELLREIRKAAQCHQPKSILIEDQASGTALQQTLKRDGYAVRPIKPKGDKVMRMRVHTPTLEAGKVLLKKRCPVAGRAARRGARLPTWQARRPSRCLEPAHDVGRRLADSEVGHL